ncbi:MAG: ankyrin repeat domain-containing protein [Kiritimatiellae bacterium]|nr:ankyrin repeat domain-containing protein [Kiritimatiellia bacterium]
MTHIINKRHFLLFFILVLAFITGWGVSEYFSKDTQNQRLYKNAKMFIHQRDTTGLEELLKEHPEIRFLRSGFNMNTLLHESVLYNDLESTKFLLAYGFCPNEVNSAGQTPLHFAYKIHNNSDLLETLFSYGASTNILERSYEYK